MDPNQHEHPDAKPKRLVVLAGAGVVVATGFATIAAMVLPTQQHDEAGPELTVTPTVSASGSDTSTDSYGNPGAVSHTVDPASASTARSRTGVAASSAAPSSGGSPLPPPKEGRPTPTGGPLPPIPPAPEPPDVPDTAPPTEDDPEDPPDGSDPPSETTSSSETTGSNPPGNTGSQETRTSETSR